MTTPIPAVMMIGHPPTSAGDRNFRMHSVIITPTAMRRIAAFSSEAQIVLFRNP